MRRLSDAWGYFFQDSPLYLMNLPRIHSEEPLAALARRYLLKTPCARMKSSYERFEELGQVIENYDIRGVIYHTLKFCDVFIYDHHPFQQFLEQRGIPLLRIETEYDPALPGQVKTRLQAFLEILK